MLFFQACICDIIPTGMRNYFKIIQVTLIIGLEHHVNSKVRSEDFQWNAWCLTIHLFKLLLISCGGRGANLVFLVNPQSRLHSSKQSEEFSLQNKLKLGLLFIYLFILHMWVSRMCWGCSTCKWSPFPNARMWNCVFIMGGVWGVKDGCQWLSSGGAANQEEFSRSCCHSQPAVMMLGQWTRRPKISLHPDNWGWLKAAALRADQTVSAFVCFG